MHHQPGGSMSFNTVIASILSGIALIAAVIHAFLPSLTIDSTTAWLIAIAVLPWLGSFFRVVELPGGLKVEYQCLKEAEERAREAGVISSEKLPQTEEPLYVRIASEDPNLALAGLRIEIERELLSLADRHGISVERKSIMQIAKELTQQNVFGAGAYLAIGDLTHLLNNAVHGAKVEPESVAWAISQGSQIVQSLRSK